MTARMLPAARPEMTRGAAIGHALHAGLNGVLNDPFFILGRRGYYRDTMGVPGQNDEGIYDDAIALVTPTAFLTVNANTDPSREAPGVAHLKAGIWSYKVGTHGLSKPKDRQYTALVQAAPVTVVRTGEGEDYGMFGINIHRGGNTTTSSLGCQTIHPRQWDSFIGLVRGEMHRHDRDFIPYVLTEYR